MFSKSALGINQVLVWSEIAVPNEDKAVWGPSPVVDMSSQLGEEQIFKDVAIRGMGAMAGYDLYSSLTAVLQSNAEDAMFDFLI